MMMFLISSLCIVEDLRQSCLLSCYFTIVFSSHGAPLAEIERRGATDPLELARIELLEKKIPFIIRRYARQQGLPLIRSFEFMMIYVSIFQLSVDCVNDLPSLQKDQ